MKQKYCGTSEYLSDGPWEPKCRSCIYFSRTEYDKEYPYKCFADTGCKAAELSRGRDYKGSCKSYKKTEEPIAHGKTSFKKTLLWSIIIPAIWAIVITIVGLIRHTFTAYDGFFTYLRVYGTGYLIGVVSYILLKLFRNVINSDLTRFFQISDMGGKILGFIVSGILPYIVPGFVFASLLLRD